MKHLLNKLTIALISTLFPLVVLAQSVGTTAILFDGNNDVFNGGLSESTFSALTVEIWIKPQAHHGTIFTKMNGYDFPENKGIALEILSSTQLQLSIGYDGGRDIGYIDALLTLNEWQNVAVSFDGLTANVYLNGVWVDSFVSSSPINSVSPFVFGSFHPSGSYSIQGELDEIKVFDVIRSESEILSDIYSGQPLGAIAYWPLNEGAGDQILDVSGNANNGFLGSVNGSTDDNNPQWVYTTTLVADYSFSGDANDQTENGYDGLVEGATLTADRFGNENSAYSFNGIDNRITVASFDAMPRFSVSLWTKRDTVNDNGYFTMLEFGNDDPWIGNEYGNFSLYESDAIDPYPFPVNEWTHFVVTYDENQVSKLYRNGVLVKQGNLPVGTSGVGLGIGYGEGDSYFRGVIDDIRIYNGPISQSEVTSLFSENGWTFPSPLTPSGLAAAAGNNQVELMWNKNASTNIRTYYIYGGTEENPTGFLDSTAVISDTTKMITGLTNGTLYYFRIKAVDLFGRVSDFSSQVSETPVGLSSDFGLAISLDGSSFVEMDGSILPNGSEPRTLEAWFRTSENNSNQVIANFGSVTYGQRFGLMVVNGNAYFVGQFNDINSDQFVADGNWHHLAATYDGEAVSLYLDGQLIGSAPYDLNTSEDGLRVGRRSPGDGFTEFFVGSIDEVRVWNYARSQTEIFDNMFLVMTGSEVGLNALYHFNEGEGTTLYDATEFGNQGTFYGTAGFVSSTGIIPTVPVELSSFTGQITNGKIVLNWSTASEKNNAGWEIQRQEDRSQKSEDRINAEWETIGFVAGKGTTTESQSYTFSSPVIGNQSPVTLRLKQLDLDGSVSYSQILTIENKPGEFALLQNYPNPFNPVTVINFRLAQKSKVDLRVFDMLGREVKTLVNQEKEAGSYSVDFSADNLPSGVYLYRLNAGSFSETKKMTILK